MGSVWLIWLDFDLKVDSNTEAGRGQCGGGGEGGRGRVTRAGGGVGVAQRRGKARGGPLSDLQ